MHNIGQAVCIALQHHTGDITAHQQVAEAMAAAMKMPDTSHRSRSLTGHGGTPE